MALTHVDLFAGIGGFHLALEQAGAKTVAAVEIDKKCQGVIAHLWPDTKIFYDIQEVTADDLISAGFDPDNGILTGGFPCQDISIAGKGAGLAGDRSGLFWEIIRLLRDLQPQWFILENVPRLLSINGGRDMGTVLEALAELGYGLAWRVLDAQYFGVPQRRRRVFIVGCLGDTGAAAAEVLFEPESLPGNPPPGGEAQPSPAPTVGARAEGGSESRTLTSTKVSTLQGGGDRGYRIDAEAAAGGHLIMEEPC